MSQTTKGNPAVKTRGIVFMAGFAVLLAAGVAAFLVSGPRRQGQDAPIAPDIKPAGSSAQLPHARADEENAAKQDNPVETPGNAKGTIEPASAETEQGQPQAKAEEGNREVEDEKLVDEFFKAIEKWMAPQGKAVTMAAVDGFRDMFRKVPKSRKEECLNHALNLVPDENVMLLAGILFDKTQDREMLNLVYNDILNRSEEVKKPILKEIFKDREHPNWTDTAWIFEVTGETPKEEEQ